MIKEDSARYQAVRDLGSEVIASIIRRGVGITEKWQEPLAKSTGEFVQYGAERLALAKEWLQNRVVFKTDEQEVYFEPQIALARALGNGFASVTRRKPLVIFFDTYELISRVDAWIRILIKTAGPNVVWVISGRDNLAVSRSMDQYLGYSADFRRNLMLFDLQELAIDDVLDYLRERVSEGEITTEIAASFHQATKGIPLALRHAVDMWRLGASPVEIADGVPDSASRQEIVKLMSQRLLIHCKDIADREALFLLAMQHHPDAEVQSALLRLIGHTGLNSTAQHADEDSSDAFDFVSRLEELSRRYSLISQAGGVRLHERSAAFLREYLLSPVMQASDSVRSIAMNAHNTRQKQQRKLERELPLLEDRCESEDWQRITLDLIYWLFWYEQRKAVSELTTYFIDGLAYHRLWSKRLIEIALTFKSILSTDNRRKIDILKNGLNDSRDTIPSMLVELERTLNSQQRQQDGDAAYQERRAIISWKTGQLLFRQGENKKAIDAYKRAELGLPEKGTALQLLLAQGYAEVGWHERKDEAFEYFLEISTRDTSHLIILGRKRLRTRDYPAAIAAYHKLTQLAPEEYLFHALLGFTYRHIGRYERAVLAFKRAIEIKKEEEFAYLGLGNSYFAMGLVEQARETFEQAIEFTNSASAHSSLVLIYRELGNEEKSRFHQTKARHLFAREQIWPRPSFYNQACFEAICGNAEEAVRLLKRAIEKSPDLIDLARHDPDFKSLLKNKCFRELTGSK